MKSSLIKIQFNDPPIKLTASWDFTAPTKFRFLVAPQLAEPTPLPPWEHEL